jgi:hypothetical protein
MSTNVHADLSSEDIHTPYRQVFTNAATRLADATVYVSADLNKKSIQLDTNQEYRLSSFSPTVWSAVNSPGGSTPNELFGNGSDGDITVSVNNFSFPSVFNANNFTLDVGKTIKPTAPTLFVPPYILFSNETFPLVIRAKTSITINGVIDCSAAAYAKQSLAATQVFSLSTDKHIGAYLNARGGGSGGGGGSDTSVGNPGDSSNAVLLVIADSNNFGTLGGGEGGAAGNGGAINTVGDDGLSGDAWTGSFGVNSYFTDSGELYPAGWVGNMFGGFQGAQGKSGNGGGYGATGTTGTGGAGGSGGSAGAPGLGGLGLILIAPQIIISGTATLRSNGSAGGAGGNGGAGGAGSGSSGGGGGGSGGAGGGGGNGGFIAIFADSITNAGTLEVNGAAGNVGGIGAVGGAGAGGAGAGGSGGDGAPGINGTTGIIIQHELT